MPTAVKHFPLFRPLQDTNRSRSMHVQHASPPRRHLCALVITLRRGTCLCRTRCQSTLLVAGETVLRTRNHQSQAHAWRRNLQCCVESGRQVGGQWRRRWGCEGVFKVEWGAKQAGMTLPRSGARMCYVALIVRFLYPLYRLR